MILSLPAHHNLAVLGNAEPFCVGFISFHEVSTNLLMNEYYECLLIRPSRISKHLQVSTGDLFVSCFLYHHTQPF
jgi:hypothetical protein